MADIHELRRERFWGNYRATSRELVRSFISDVQDHDSEVVLSTARKAAVLLDTARLARLWTPSAIHVSDRALEYPTDWLRGRTVTVVDDVVGTGKTLDSVLTRLDQTGVASVAVTYIAAKAQWSGTIGLLRDRHPTAVIPPKPLIADGPSLVYELVASINSLPRPYNIDWPLFAGWRLSPAELDWLIADPNWTVRQIRRSPGSAVPGLVTLEAGNDIREELAESVGVSPEQVALSKVRLYLEPLADGRVGVCALGLGSLAYLERESIERLGEEFQPHGRTPYGIARLAQYQLSHMVARTFLARGETFLGSGLMAESAWQRHLCFGPEVVLGPSSNTSTEGRRPGRPLNRSTLGANQSRLARSLMLSAMQDASARSPYRLARTEARESPTMQASFLAETPRREAFTFDALVAVVRDEFEVDTSVARQEVSSFLDDAIDSGATVPSFSVDDVTGTIRKTFRAGETIRFSKREQQLLLALLVELLYEGEMGDLDRPKNFVGRTFLEKSLVLAVRYAAQRPGVVEVLDRAAHGVPTLTVSYSRHGAILDKRASAVSRPIADEHTITFGKLLERSDLIEWRTGDDAPRPYATLVSEPEPFVDDYAVHFRSLGAILAKVHDGDVLSNREMEALGTLCNGQQHPLALLAEIDRIRGFLEWLLSNVRSGLRSHPFARSLRRNHDVGISIHAAFEKLGALIDDSSAAAASRVAGVLDRRDRIHWDDLTTRVFVSPSETSIAMTNRAMRWLLRLGIALDELRIELRSPAQSLPTSNRLARFAEDLGLADEMGSFRASMGERWSGTVRMAAAVADLLAEASDLNEEISLYYDSDCLNIEPVRFNAVVVLRSNATPQTVDALLRGTDLWRDLLPMPYQSLGEGFHGYAVVRGGAGRVAPALAASSELVDAGATVVGFTNLPTSARVLRREYTDQWSVQAFAALCRSEFVTIPDSPGCYLWNGNRERTLEEIYMPRHSERREEVDIVLLCAARQEWEVLQTAVFGGRRSSPAPATRRHVIRGTAEFGSRTFSVAALCPSDQGSEEMLMMVNEALASFSAKAICLVGIAGALDGDVEIGDVMVATRVDRYERGKLENGGFEHELVTSGFPVPDLLDLTGRVGNITAGQSLPFRVHVGVFAAGEKVVADQLSEIAQWIRQTNRKCLAVEMESGGFFKGLLGAPQSVTSGVEWFVCKGASDRADQSSMARPEDPEELRKWEERRRADQHQATRNSVNAALALVAERDSEPD